MDWFQRLNNLYEAKELDALRSEARLSEAAGWPKSALFLGLADLGQQRWEAALSHFQRYIQQVPEDGVGYYNAGLCLNRLERLEEAAWYFREAIPRKGDRPEVWNGLGVALTALGQGEAARACHRRALALDPGDVEALFNLAQSQVHHTPPPQLPQLQQAAAHPGHTEWQRARVNFALGKIYNDLGEHQRAFTHYSQANALLGPQYDPKAHARYDAALRQAFPQPIRPLEGASSRPVLLVVGMPRSGTTLINQILTRHPACGSVGEQPWLREALEETGAYPKGWECLAPGLRLAAGEGYLDKLPPDPPWILDKTPLNGFHLGAAGQVLAGMKVILCRRDPRDVGLSCFFQCFTDGHEYSRDLGHLGRFMRRYFDLLAFWKRRLPEERWLEVSYEALVRDPETQIRRMLDFLGLPWEPDCLDHRHNPNPVRTASRWQVREPLYTRSIGRWRHYAPWLGPLLEGLEGR